MSCPDHLSPLFCVDAWQYAQLGEGGRLAGRLMSLSQRLYLLITPCILGITRVHRFTYQHKEPQVYGGSIYSYEKIDLRISSRVLYTITVSLQTNSAQKTRCNILFHAGPFASLSFSALYAAQSISLRPESTSISLMCIHLPRFQMKATM